MSDFDDLKKEYIAALPEIEAIESLQQGSEGEIGSNPFLHA